LTYSAVKTVDKVSRKTPWAEVRRPWLSIETVWRS
jgi:hypothetical protein